VISGKEQIEALIPHAGRMCLLDELVEWDQDHIRCLARSHRATDNPMRAAGRLAAVCGIEYAMQAVALHGGLALQGQRANAGYLASVRDVLCHVTTLDEYGDDPLSIEARRMIGDATGAIYRFSVSVAGRPLIEGRATVILEA
jgi:predicted hotdog family 3-hydroxylacyl-ACP dehydratase